jgi:hypothetical protein
MSELTLNDFGDRLDSLPVGKTATLPYSVYEILFPPGAPDQKAWLLASNFAKEHECEIDNETAAQQVVFTKKRRPRNVVEPYNDFT